MIQIQIPLWLLVILSCLAVLYILQHLFLPSIRWYFRRKVKRLIDQLNENLSFELPKFKFIQRKSLVDGLIFDDEVQKVAKIWAYEQGQTLDEVMEEVDLYAHEIVPSFNVFFYFRVGYTLARKVSQWFYRVRLGHHQGDYLQEIPKDAAVIFVLNHRSNLDYILVSYLVGGQTALSYAVGEWARVWPLQKLIRAMGAFFVRRHSSNELYRKVLERYIQRSTQAGVTQAIFLEGKLSTDGKANPPKIGLLDYTLREYDPNNPETKDIYLVPVGLNYDRTLEDRTLLTHPEEVKKNKRQIILITVGFLWKNLSLKLRGKWHRFGYACVNFGEPISIKETLLKEGITFKGMKKEERIPEVQKIADQAMESIKNIIPVLPLCLVARTLLLHSRDEGLTQLDIKAIVFSMQEELEKQEIEVYVPRKDFDYAIWVGLRMLILRQAVIENDAIYTVVEKEVKLLEYYANSIVHFFQDK